MPASRKKAASKQAQDTESQHSAGVRLIKKYPNRRLYDPQSSSYIALSDLKHYVIDGQSLLVQDATTGQDITRSLLLQIILEEEAAGGVPLFTTATLQQIIRFYGHAMRGLMGYYLEKNLQTFIDLQSQFLNPFHKPPNKE